MICSMSSRTVITSFPLNLCSEVFSVFPADLAGTSAIIGVTCSQLQIYCSVCLYADNDSHESCRNMSFRLL